VWTFSGSQKDSKIIFTVADVQDMVSPSIYEYAGNYILMEIVNIKGITKNLMPSLQHCGKSNHSFHQSRNDRAHHDGIAIALCGG